MSSIIMFNMMSVDGYFEGPNGELDWHVVDQEFHDYSYMLLCSVSAIIFGRVTFEHMKNYWPTASAQATNPAIAEKMNELPKFVFSNTLTQAEWGKWDNAELIAGHVTGEVPKLKSTLDGDLVLLGSANLASSLISHDLIDEYRIMVNPVVLGSGQPLLRQTDHKRNLKLINTKSFRSGNVLLRYRPDADDKERVVR